MKYDCVLIYYLDTSVYFRRELPGIVTITQKNVVLTFAENYKVNALDCTAFINFII